MTITSPSSSTVTGSPMHVVGKAYSGYTVTATQVYLDGVLKYKSSTNTVNTYVSLSIGTHTLAVQGWDSSGATFKKTMSVTRTR